MSETVVAKVNNLAGLEVSVTVCSGKVNCAVRLAN